ncbi:RHS repeat-associated core domain-containing protein [Paenibacillus sp. WLX2291]|uniref:RHS repeat-associated core domain-containing protein n=1 Tax=Paenibacillus sp. WLX2291 TaxID=3296934 RepID=UPI0039844D96
MNNYQYDELGNLTQQKDTIANDFKYASETYDADISLCYLKARYYDPSLEPFLNEDSYERQMNSPLNMNGYSCVHNNPMVYVDPTGHWIADDSNLNAASQNKVKQATKEFDNAKKRGDVAGMQAAHNKAVEIRFSSGDYEVVNKMNYTTGKSTPYSTGNGGVHIDNTWTGFVFDSVATGGVGIGSKAVTKGVASVVQKGVNSSEKFTLGLSEHLDSFAANQQAKTWKNFPDENWKSIVTNKLNDTNEEIKFNLTGIDNPWSAPFD